MQELWAIIFKPWPNRPTYHALGPNRRTRCGRRLGGCTPMLPMKHVRKFGKPCKSCWPGE